VVWSDQWSDEEIDAVREKDARVTAAYFNTKNAGKAKVSSSASAKKGKKKGKTSLKGKIKNWLGVQTPD